MYQFKPMELSKLIKFAKEVQQKTFIQQKTLSNSNLIKNEIYFSAKRRQNVGRLNREGVRVEVFVGHPGTNLPVI